MTTRNGRTTTEKTAQCCVVGGGPAGMMLGLLLARQGVDVIVLEKHEDFFRDFRGDTIHPSTLDVLGDIGLIDRFLALPHRKMEQVTMDTPGGAVPLADFTKLPGPHRYIAFVPQWDFLELLAEEASRYGSFELVRPAEVTSLLEDSGKVTGVRARTDAGWLEVRADLVVGADGRHSAVREQAGLPLIAASAPMDVLWFRLAREEDEEVAFFRKVGSSVVIAIDRGEYWQIAYVIPQSGFAEVRRNGLIRFRETVATVLPELAERTAGLQRWDDVKLLTVRVDRLQRWFREGLLCIGDAAHAMSPAGGVGINLAIQDAVATANILGPAFASGSVTTDHLRSIQRRRQFPVRATQAFQVRALRDLYPRAGAPQSDRLPFAMRLLRRVPIMRHAAGRFIGRGIRPERVRGSRSSASGRRLRRSSSPGRAANHRARPSAHAYRGP